MTCDGDGGAYLDNYVHIDTAINWDYWLTCWIYWMTVLARCLLILSGMARIPRYLIVDDNSTLHITWQCHNKEWFLEANSMKQLYYDLLLKYKPKYHVKVHSYSFMSSHPHLTLTCESKELLSGFFRVVNSSFAKMYNKINDRKGQVIIDRFKSPRINTDEDHIRVIFYGDFNQVRAKMVKHPKDWRWSSYRHYAYGEEDPLIDDAPFYTQLGRTADERHLRYRQLVNDILWDECICKQNYSAVYFIGNPIWVQRKTENLREKVKNRKPGTKPQEIDTSNLSPPG